MSEEYSKIISENCEKGTQLRLVLSSFKDTDYLHLRKYYLDFEGEFVPSKEGISMPATIASVYALLDGLIEICAREENISAVLEHFQEIFEKLKNERET